MKRIAIAPLLLFAALALAARAPAADEPDAKLRERLIGTWKLVSAEYGGREFKFPEGSTMVKHVTPTHFMWATYGTDGVVTRAAGGTYSLEGDKYEENPTYGLSGDFDIIKGKPQTFTCRIEGDTWHHDGELSNGLTIEEVWERVKDE